MFKTFFIRELKTIFKTPMIYIFFVLMTLLVFGAVSSDNIRIGGAIGNIHRNAPYIITVYTTIMSIFGLLIAAAFFNNAALRDYLNNFNEILFSTPLSKSGYFFGRFFAALVASTIPLLGVFAGIVLGTYVAPLAGWVDALRFGSLHPDIFLHNYFLFVLPNMFFAGAIIFALANIWKSTVVSFVGSMGIVIAYIIAGTLVSDLDNETVGALLDSFGIRTFMTYAKYFTPAEKNTLIPPFSGLLLTNRLIWIAVGTLILWGSYFRFSFQNKSRKAKKIKKQKHKPHLAFELPSLHSNFDWHTHLLQAKSFILIHLRLMIKSVTFKILLIFSAIQLFLNLQFGFDYMGLKSYPITYKVLDIISNSAGLFVIIVVVFFSGELIWRNREAKINEVMDATPHSTIISLFSKVLSLVSLAALLHLFLLFCGIVYQLTHAYWNIELSVYLLDFLYAKLPLYFVWSAVMIAIQVLINQKYLSYFISILVVFIWPFIMQLLHIESNMLIIGGAPSIRYSDMNAFGPGLPGAIWFSIYWSLFAILFLLFAGLFWDRGLHPSISSRMRQFKQRLTPTFLVSMSVIGVIFFAVAGFVFYNTQILNPYKTSKEQDKLAADYEKKYKKYENVNLPKISEAKYFIDIFPYKRDAYVKAVFRLTNESQLPIDSLHFVLNDDWETQIFIPNSTLVLNDKTFSYQIFRLDSALQPNESMEIEISAKYITRGFENERGSTKIVKNGTFFNNFDALPSLGYNPRYELYDKNTRKKYGLPPNKRMPPLNEADSLDRQKNYLTLGHSDFIPMETTISTAGDQIAVAPGSLRKKWTENGRNYYRYVLDHPSQHFCSFVSARYEVARERWGDVDIEVYYHPAHGRNVPKMLAAVKRSLDYYTQHFGPYYHRQCRIIEFPRYASFAQAFPGTMPYSEALGFVTNLEDETKNSIVDAVIAHEMAHQWWAHQLVGALMQGATMLSESFAEYSSLMTMKNAVNDPMRMRNFLKYDHDRYLKGRSTEISKELPLYKVENQTYIHYGKGSVILFALQDYIGEERMNKAMQNFLNEYKYRKPPYPTSLDFLRYLEPQVPDSMKYLIEDGLKNMVLYDNRLQKASYRNSENGKYEVHLEIEAHKLQADTLGNEHPLPISDWIDLGLFADNNEERLLFQKRVKITEEKMLFTFTVDSLPVRAAIDPRHLLIDRVYSDNSKNVTKVEK